MKLDPQKHKSRLTVVEYLYYQSNLNLSSPEGAECRWTRPVESEDQLYTRRLTVGEAWQPLDTGWIKEVGEVHISNEEGKHLQLIPSAEEQAAIDSKVVLVRVGSDGGVWLVRSSETFHGCPGDTVYVCCAKGEARIVVTVVPA